MDPDLPMADVKTMEQLVHESIAPDRFDTLLFGSFAAVALLLAAWASTASCRSSSPSARTEIGLRMALGAGARRVRRPGAEGRDGDRRASATALGSIGAYFVGRAMQGMWFGVGAIDPIAFSAVALALILAALLACIVPARRAASVDPLTALRE